MRLAELVMRCATSVDLPSLPEQQRFGPTKQQRILAAVAEAPGDEVDEALPLARAGASPYRGPGHGNLSLWEGKDEVFRGALESALHARKCGRAVSPELATPPPRSRVAVLLIDAQYDHLRGHTKEDLAYEHQRMLEVLRRANALGVPVFEVVVPKVYETDPVLAQARNPSTWVRVEKTTNSPFASTNIEEELRDRGVEEVIVMGLHADACVAATAADAVQRGLLVSTSPDLVQSFSGTNELHPWYYAACKVVADPRELCIFAGVDAALSDTKRG